MESLPPPRFAGYRGRSNSVSCSIVPPRTGMPGPKTWAACRSCEACFHNKSMTQWERCAPAQHVDAAPTCIAGGRLLQRAQSCRAGARRSLPGIHLRDVIIDLLKNIRDEKMKGKKFKIEVARKVVKKDND